MKYILDTCSFIWYIETSGRLPTGMRELIDDAEYISVSKASLWEIAIKQTTGKLALNKNSFDLEELCKAEDITILPLKLPYFERIKKLPLIHKDPFDRIIMATAIEEGLTILTCDENIIKYDDVKTLWKTTKED